MNKFASIFLLLLSGLFTLTSCDDEDDVEGEDPNPSADETTGNLVLKMEPFVGEKALQSGSANTLKTTAQERRVLFSEAKFYLSDFSLEKPGGGNWPLDGGTPGNAFDDQYLLYQYETSEYLLEDLEPGSYEGINFTIGVDSAVNTKVDPSSWPGDHALSSARLHFGYWAWNNGYKFVVLEGQLDTTDTPDGTLEGNMVMHLGLDELLRDANLSQNFQIEAGKTDTLAIKVDVAQFLKGLDLAKRHETHTINGSEAKTIATQIADNGPDVFSIMQ